MKKTFIFLLIAITFIAIGYGESRKFFCLEDGQCITVWKTYNNVCYITPGKDYSVIKPSDNFIELTNTNDLTVFFTRELPNSFIFASDHPLKINNGKKDKFTFYDYNLNTKKFDQILYKPDAKKANDLKDNAKMMNIYVFENYATDTKGRKLCSKSQLLGKLT